MKKIDYKALIISILIPNVLAGLTAIFLDFNAYQNMVKPPLSPPKIVFPIAWVILYTLMGISSYMIYKSNNLLKTEALKSYGLQLGINLVWSFIFFNFKAYFISFIWIIILIISVLRMIKLFLEIKPRAGQIQIPYLLWLLFATYLNFGVFILN